MHVTTIDLVTLSGTLVELAPHWRDAPAHTDIPVTFNQSNHLRALGDPAVQSVWIAGTVDLAEPGAIDLRRAADAVTRLLREHDAFRARFQVGGEAPVADVFAPEQVTVTPAEIGTVDSAAVAELLDQRCRGGEHPAVFFGLLDSTLLVAFDHFHGDALTVDLILRRVHELYADPDSDPRPGQSFFDRSELDAVLREKLATVDGEHPGLSEWRRYFTATGGRVPPFPLPLGEIPPGGAKQRTRVEQLLDDDAAEALGSKPFARALSALASEIHRLGGPATLSTIIPVHTRGRSSSPWHQTAGWLVTNAPVRVRAGDTAGAVRALRNAIGMAQVPLDHVLHRCAPDLGSSDLFMVSYLDYRRLGPALPGARHISASTTTDSVQLWFSRTHDGLDLRVRYPQTPVAEATIDELVSRLRNRLCDAARASSSTRRATA